MGSITVQESSDQSIATAAIQIQDKNILQKKFILRSNYFQTKNNFFQFGILKILCLDKLLEVVVFVKGVLDPPTP